MLNKAGKANETLVWKLTRAVTSQKPKTTLKKKRYQHRELSSYKIYTKGAISLLNRLMFKSTLSTVLMVLLKLQHTEFLFPRFRPQTHTKKIHASSIHETLSILRNWVWANTCQPNRKKSSHVTQFV